MTVPKIKVEAAGTSSLFGPKGEALPPRYKKVVRHVLKTLKAADVVASYGKDFEGTAIVDLGSKVTYSRLVKLMVSSGCTYYGSAPGAKGFRTVHFSMPGTKTPFYLCGYDNAEDLWIGKPHTRWTKKDADAPAYSIVDKIDELSAATGLKFKVGIRRKSGLLSLQALLRGRLDELMENLVEFGGKRMRVKTLRGSRDYIYLPALEARAYCEMTGGGGGDSGIVVIVD